MPTQTFRNLPFRSAINNAFQRTSSKPFYSRGTLTTLASRFAPSIQHGVNTGILSIALTRPLFLSSIVHEAAKASKETTAPTQQETPKATGAAEKLITKVKRTTKTNAGSKTQIESSEKKGQPAKNSSSPQKRISTRRPEKKIGLNKQKALEKQLQLEAKLKEIKLKLIEKMKAAEKKKRLRLKALEKAKRLKLAAKKKQIALKLKQKSAVPKLTIVPPKKPKSAFIFFAQEFAKKPENTKLNIIEKSKAASAVWRSMTPQEAAPYYQKALDNKNRYKQEYEEYLKIRPESDVEALKIIRRVRRLRKLSGRAPKPRPVTPYNVFFKAIFENRKAEGTKVDPKILLKNSHAAFKALNPEEKKVYETKAAEINKSRLAPNTADGA